MYTLLITLAFPPARGGMQRLMAERVALSNGRMVVVAPHRQGGAWDLHGKSPVWRWPGGASGWPGVRRLWQVCWAGWGGWQVTRRYPVGDVELGQALPFGPVAWALARSYTVWAFGDEILKPWGHPLGRPVLRRVLSRARLVYAVSHYTAGLVRRAAPQADVEVVYPWPAHRFTPGDRTEARRSLGIASDVLLILTVARLEPRKGVDRVLRVLPSLARQFPRLRYAIVGAGRARVRWEALAARLGVSDRVWWVGDVDDSTLVSWYRAADVFVLVPTPGPGEVEGFGLVYVEAAACGVPAVAGRNGGTPEAVLHGRTGVVVDPADEAELVSALASLLSDEARRTALGRAARLHAQRLRERAARQLRFRV